MSKRGAVTIYGIKNCDTMKKAFTWLEGRKLDYAFHDYKKEGIDRATLYNKMRKYQLRKDGEPELETEPETT